MSNDKGYIYPFEITGREAQEMNKKAPTREELTPKEGEPAWGLYDKKDDVWLGDDKGPTLYNEEIWARVSARITETQLGYEPGRLEAKSFDWESLRKRDELKTQMSAVEALRRIENGEV